MKKISSKSDLAEAFINSRETGRFDVWVDDDMIAAYEAGWTARGKADLEIAMEHAMGNEMRREMRREIEKLDE